MKYIDISWPLSENMTTYKNKPNQFSVQPTRLYEQDKVRESKICIGSHVGTHLDLPAHMLEKGSSEHSGVIIGECQVVDMTHVKESIKAEDLKKVKIVAKHVLLKTTNSLLKPDAQFNPNFVYLAASGAEYLQRQGVETVGIDYLGLEREQLGHPSHTILLENNIAVLEGLRLEVVDAGSYNLTVLTLALESCDGLPARAMLIDN